MPVDFSHHPAMTGLDPSSRSWLSPRDLPRFAGETLFDRVAQVVCAAHCLPRKELYESWAVARRVRRRLRGGRVVDLAAGHGLTACLLLLLDDSSESALAVDTRLPASAARLLTGMVERWPRMRDRVSLVEQDLDTVRLSASDLVVSVHACGALTDRVIERAVQVRARVAVLPCCHDEETCDTGGLLGWLDVGMAVDTTRALRLRERGYQVHTQLIPEEITPKNRLLIAQPVDEPR
ncbi:MAG: methyltransferase [Myxococcales bacterium]